VIPEEQAMAAAFKQYQILLSIKVLREIKLNAQQSRERRERLSAIQEILHRSKMQRLFYKIV